MADNFDPYHVWLGISRAEQPPHHYRLLGIDAFESDLDVIEGAADRQMSHVQKHKIGAHSADSQKLLNQLAAARVTLLNPARKTDYDQKLRAKLAAQAAPAASAQVAPAVTKVQAAAVPVSPAMPNSPAEIFQAVPYQPRAASERTAPRQGRKTVKKSKIHPAFYAIPVIVVLGGVGGWLMLQKSAAPPAIQAKAQAHGPDKKSADKRSAGKKSAGKASKRETTEPTTEPTTTEPTTTEPTTTEPATPEPAQTPAASLAARNPSHASHSAKNPQIATAVVAEPDDSSAWLDLLSLIGKSQTISGNWNLQEPGSLRCVAPPDMYARLMLPVIPPREYEIEAVILRNASEIDFGLASGSRHFVLVVDGWNNQATTGFQLVDGKPGNDPALGAHAGEVVPQRGSGGSLKIVVRTTGVTLDFNGQRMLTWSDGLERLGADESSLNTPDPRRLFLAGRGEPFRFNKLRLRSLSGEQPRVLSAGASATVSIGPGNPAGPLATGGQLPTGGQQPAAGNMNPGVAIQVNPAAGRPPENSNAAKKPALPFKILQDQGEHVNCGAISPDGHWVMWATNRGTNNLWDVRKGKLAAALDSRQQPVQKAAFTQDSRRLITVSFHAALVWDMQTGQLVRTVPLPQTGQIVVGLSPDGRMVGSLESKVNAVSIIDPLGGELLYRPEVHGNTCIGFSTSGKFAFISGYTPVEGNASQSFNQLFDVPAKREVPCGLNMQGAAQAVAFSGDGSRMAVSDTSFSIKIWDLVKNGLLTTIRPFNSEGAMNRLAFTPDGRKLLGGGPGADVNVWDAETGKKLLDLPGHEKWATDLQTTADGRIALTTDGAGAVRLWRLEEAGSLIAASSAATTEPPDLAKQQAAATLIKDVYADDFAKAKKPAEKLALADKLLNLSQTSQDLSEKYVLIVKARDLAREAGEPFVFLQAVQALGATFKVEMYEMALAGVDGLAKENLPPRARQDLAEGLLPLAARAVEQDKFEEARKLLLAAQIAARKSNDTASLKTIVARLAEIGDARKQAEEIKAAEEAVAKNPDDPAANLALGKIYCLTKDDWSAGLPLLAKSSDESFKALAVQEIAQPREAAEQTKLADGWYALADGATGKAKSRLLQHAATWYRRAEPSLSGLMQVKISKRLEEITARISADAGEPVAGADKPAASNPASPALPLAARIKTAIKKETYVNSRLVGSTNSGKKFFELTPNGGILVGFNYTAEDNNSGQITSMQAIYQIGRNVAPGAVWGQPRGTPGTITAKKGYAVGGLKMTALFHATGFEVTFMKIDRNMLDPKDKYASPWIGSSVNQGSTKSVESDGQPVIGILGYAEYWMYGLGLVQLPGQ